MRLSHGQLSIATATHSFGKVWDIGVTSLPVVRMEVLLSIESRSLNTAILGHVQDLWVDNVKKPRGGGGPLIGCSFKQFLKILTSEF